MRWFCMDCRRPVEMDVHGYCSRCGSAALADNEGRATLDKAALEQMEQHLEWLAWAQRVIDGASKERA